MDEGGQTTASQALLSPTRLKIMCLCGVIQHRSFQVALQFSPLCIWRALFHFTHCSELAAVISEAIELGQMLI